MTGNKMPASLFIAWREAGVVEEEVETKINLKVH
jgi:hypothetical protein